VVLSSAVVRAALLTGLEGLALVVAGVVYAVDGATGAAASLVGAELAAVMIVALGLLVLAAGRALARRRRWARSPVVVVQLLGGLTALDLVRTPVWPAAVGVLVVAAAVLWQLALPEARQAFAR
jgi:hypothetical protein